MAICGEGSHSLDVSSDDWAPYDCVSVAGVGLSAVALTWMGLMSAGVSIAAL